uniref:Reverse transcriptase domain-containing protein n=1 Tax=Rhabditophanes sp. KR3021 TaxID=114890 RepID=A0AC35TSM9_9BILA
MAQTKKAKNSIDKRKSALNASFKQKSIESRTLTNNEETIYHKNEKTKWKNFEPNWPKRCMNDDAGTSLEELQKVGIKDVPLMPIQYENIITPLLHITMGLNVDINSKIKPLLNAVYEKRLITFYKKIGIRMRNYWELFSGNHVKKLMKNVDKYIATLPNGCEKMVNMKTILKCLSVVYDLVLKAVPDDKDKLREALNDLINAYKNGSYSREFSITPKAHTFFAMLWSNLSYMVL